jgi:5-methylcytosine-specific restriction endonuclease McrA
MSAYVVAANPRGMTYLEYLDSKVWRDKRRKVRRRAKYRCEECGRPEETWLYGKWDVHHLRYPAVLGEEPLEWLILLCTNCHAARHPKRVEAKYERMRQEAAERLRQLAVRP